MKAIQLLGQGRVVYVRDRSTHENKELIHFLKVEECVLGPPRGPISLKAGKISETSFCETITLSLDCQRRMSVKYKLMEIPSLPEPLSVMWLSIVLMLRHSK